MKDFGIGTCPTCTKQFIKKTKHHKYCCETCSERNRHKGRVRKYSKKREARRVIRDAAKIAVRDKAKKRFPHPQPCETCGQPGTDRHHDNYNKPFDIRWLCGDCHNAWHKVNKAIPPQKHGEQIPMPL